MTFELKTSFETAEDAIAYITGDVAAELKRLGDAEQNYEQQKQRILANRDEVLNEKKTLQQRLDALEQEHASLKQTANNSGDLESKFSEIKTQLEKDYNDRIQKIEDERAQEKAQAHADKVKAAAIAEFSKPDYGIINPEEFYRLHGGDLDVDEANTVFRKIDEFDKQTAAQLIEDIRSNPSHQYKFKPKGGKGNDSPGAGSGGTLPASNPFKTGNLTEQSQLFKQSPALYHRLKAEAGKA